MFKNRRKQKEDGLSIIIVGCGKVGATLVDRLVREGHDVTIIDNNPEVITDIMNNYDVMGIVGNGASFSVQMDAGVEKTDVLIAVTGSDELNLLCCVVGKRVADCDVIARVRTPDYSDDIDYLKKQLGLAMIINPEEETARSIARTLYLPNALEVRPFAHGKAEIVRVKLPKGNVLEGSRLMDVSKELTGQVLICAVERLGNVFIPTGEFKLAENDIITFISPAGETSKFLKRLGFNAHQVRNSIIIGGGRTTYYLARLLLKMRIDVTIIERDRGRCEDLSLLMPNAELINGDGTDEDLLKEVGIESTDAFVSLTGLDEENILLTLYARDVSDAKVVTKINRINFNQVINNLDLGSVIYPKHMTMENIIAFVRAKMASMNSNIETMHYMNDERVEAIEFIIEHDSRITNKSLKELQLKDNILVACINRGGEILIPSGNDMFKPGDSVIIVTTNSGYSDILDILK